MITHKHILLMAVAGLVLLVAGIIFIFNYKKILSKISGSLTDPSTGNWSPKIITGCAAANALIVTYLVWLKSAYLKDDFSQLQFMVTALMAFITSQFVIKSIEKMQANKLGLNGETNSTNPPT